MFEIVSSADERQNSLSIDFDEEKGLQRSVITNNSADSSKPESTCATKNGKVNNSVSPPNPSRII